MKGKVYTKEFKETILQEVNETNDVAQVARRHDLSTKTIYSWRKQAGHKAWAVTSTVTEFIDFYVNRYLHGSLKDMSPACAPLALKLHE